MERWDQKGNVRNHFPASVSAEYDFLFLEFSSSLSLVRRFFSGYHFDVRLFYEKNKKNSIAK